MTQLCDIISLVSTETALSPGNGEWHLGNEQKDEMNWVNWRTPFIVNECVSCAEQFESNWTMNPHTWTTHNRIYTNWNKIKWINNSSLKWI